MKNGEKPIHMQLESPSGWGTDRAWTLDFQIPTKTHLNYRSNCYVLGKSANIKRNLTYNLPLDYRQLARQQRNAGNQEFWVLSLALG